MSSRRSTTVKKEQAAVLVLLVWLLLPQRPQWLLCGLGRPAVAPRAVDVHPGPTFGMVGNIMRPRSPHAKQSLIARRVSSSTSDTVSQTLIVDNDTLEERVSFVQVLKQNAVPGLLDGLAANVLAWDGRVGAAGMHVHEGILLFTETGKEVRIDRVSNIDAGTSDVRMRMHREVAALREWKQTGTLAVPTWNATVQDLWMAALPHQQYVFMGDESNNCQDTVGRVLAAATGQEFQRGYAPEKYATVSAAMISGHMGIVDDDSDEAKLSEFRDLIARQPHLLGHKKKALEESYAEALEHVRKIKWTTSLLFQASAAVISHACLLHKEVKVLESNVEVLGTANADLAQGIERARLCLKDAEEGSNVSALALAYDAVISVCTKAETIKTALSRIIREAEDAKQEARNGFATSLCLLVGAGAVSLIAPPAGAGLLAAEEMAMLRAAQGVAGVTGCGGMWINHDTLERCKLVQKEANNYIRVVMAQKERFIGNVTKFLMYSPERFDNFCQHVSSSGVPHRTVLKDVFNQLRKDLLSDPAVAVDFIPCVRNRWKALVTERVLDEELADKMLAHLGFGQGTAAHWLGYDRFASLMHHATEQWHALLGEALKLPAKPSLEDYQKSIHELLHRLGPQPATSRGKVARLLLIDLHDSQSYLSKDRWLELLAQRNKQADLPSWSIMNL